MKKIYDKPSLENEIIYIEDAIMASSKTFSIEENDTNAYSNPFEIY